MTWLLIMSVRHHDILAYPTGIFLTPTGFGNVLHEGCKTTPLHEISMTILTF